jgi:uncharacterized protein (TIGR03083 family)
MDVDDYIAAISYEASTLAEAAQRIGLDAHTPTCPGWQVRDVVGHLGGVHRWATSFVRDAVTDPGDVELEQPPGDDELLPWFYDGFAALVEALQKAPDDLECWTFLPAPTRRHFWARRQSHETSIHRVDVQRAGGDAAGFESGFAIDGIDELLLGFFSRRRGKLLADPPVTVGVQPVDGPPDAAWTMSIGPQGREVTRGSATGDCVVTGRASDLYLLLWNRQGVDGIEVSGDSKVLDLWREKAQVTWS